MFQATVCPSSGELTVSMRHWSHLNQQTRQSPIQNEKYQCHIDTVSYTDNGHIVARNMQRSGNKCTKKKCAASWIHLKQIIQGYTVKKT